MTPALSSSPPAAAPARRARLVLGITLAVGLGLPAGLFGAVLVLSPLSRIASPLWSAVAMVALAFVLVTFGAVISGVTVWWEMRVSARMQSRVGYNRVGAAGFLQWVADAVKLLFKEDLVPADADQLLFRAAPYFVLVGFALTFVALPFGEGLIAADLDVGIFYVLSVTALVVVGILLAGWSSNSKWSLFGGMRAAAQVVSYEIPAGLAAMVPVLMAGSLSMQQIIGAQGAWPWQWFALSSPFAGAAFVIFFIAQLAEGNRTPFDLPEAESELVAGYLSEYSSFRFAIYFLVEFGNLWVMSAIAATLFFGGWQVPFAGPEVFAAARGAGAVPGLWWWGLEVLSMAVFVAKTLVLMNVIIWVRWTLPRIRVDQMMSLCWKYLVPFAFASLVGALFWQILLARVPAVAPVTGLLATAATAVGAFFFLRLTYRNLAAVGDRVDLSNW
jgi:NADH-quinone oxidoreductase subunit H